jgi:hypothetical protein
MQKLEWDEDAYIAQYYRGLRDSTKDELVHHKRPGQLQMELDNRRQERQEERRGEGHRTDADCRAKRQVNTIRKEQNDKDQHDGMHWRFCYDDSCLTHLSSKNGAGWYPSAPRQKEMPAVDDSGASLMEATIDIFDGAEKHKTATAMIDSGSEGYENGSLPRNGDSKKESTSYSHHL